VVIVIVFHGLPHSHATSTDLHAALRAELNYHLTSAQIITITRITSLTGAALFTSARRLQGTDSAGVNVTIVAAAADQSAASAMAAHVSSNRGTIATSVRQALTSSPSLSPELQAVFANNVTVLVGSAAAVNNDVPPSPVFPLGAVVGGVVGGLALIVAGLVGYRCWKNRTQRRSSVTPGTHVSTPFDATYTVVRELGRGAFGVAYLASPRVRAPDSSDAASASYVVIKSTAAPIDAKAMREVESLMKVRVRRRSGCHPDSVGRCVQAPCTHRPTANRR